MELLKSLISILDFSLCIIIINNNNDKLMIIVTVIIIYYYYPGTISKYTQAININIKKDFALQHTCCLQSEIKNKEYHHGGFQQQSPCCLIDRYKHTNSLNDGWMLHLKSLLVV